MRGSIIEDDRLRMLPSEQQFNRIEGVWNLSSDQVRCILHSIQSKFLLKPIHRKRLCIVFVYERFLLAAVVYDIVDVESIS